MIIKMQMKFQSSCGNQVNDIDINLTTTKMSKTLVIPTVSMYMQVLIFDMLPGSHSSFYMGLTSELQLVKRSSHVISHDPVRYKLSVGTEFMTIS